MDEKPMRVVMSVAATTAPSPGWYPDPRSSEHLRWWDGSAWTEHQTEGPRSEPEPRPETGPRHEAARAPGFVLDLAEVVAADDPIEFSWGDTIEAYALEPEPEPDPEPMVAEPEPEPEPEPAPSPIAGTFAFRARPLHPEPRPDPEAAPARPTILYSSPLDTIASPLPERAPAPVKQVARGVVPAPRGPRVRSAVPLRAAKGSAGLVVLAAAAAGLTNLLGGDDASTDRLPSATVAISAEDKRCLKEWNTTASAEAAEMRVTLGQFTGAYAHVGRVAPLPGTLMAPDSCALTVHDPATDTDAVFVAGVEDQLGYIDVTTYPRALEQYPTPKSAKAGNVSIGADGTIAAG